MAAFKVIVNINLHIIELDFHTVEQRIVICGPRRNLVKRIDHLYDSVKNTLGKHKTQISRRRRKRRRHKSFLNALFIAPSSAHQVTKTLYDHTASKHIGKPCNTFPVTVAVLKRLRKMFCHQKRKVRVRRLLTLILIAVSVHSDNAVCVLIDHNSVWVHTKRAHPVLKLFRAVNNLALIKLIGQMRKDHRRKLHPYADVHTI